MSRRRCSRSSSSRAPWDLAGAGGAVTTKPVTVTVTQPNGEVVEGALQALDDFNIALRDAQGNYRSFKITPELKVVKHDPYAMHIALLDNTPTKTCTTSLPIWRP